MAGSHQARASQPDARFLRSSAVLILGLIAGVLASGSRADAQNPCEPVDIALNASVGGSLSAGDCTIADLGLAPDDTSFVDVYRVQIATDDVVTVRLESVDFDAFLAIFDESLTQLIAFDDDGSGASDSLIENLVLPTGPGPYRILANSFLAGETGSYTLTLPEPSAEMLWPAALVLVVALASGRRRAPPADAVSPPVASSWTARRT